ncbi:N,N-dimethylformamidase beta subunit family domain-containing protein [Fodinicurvata fenggangensis]|uniref:N,N-dimethylformamidase beta subunit family domain-containing protein n=1 Tax=Fodinicurvata fenggangensis TaxID=1121830 RepID=UPI0009DE6912|nr:N,N-dimethylformamidase beta subunit family domain-containing protein [Fodinicurvata fenggangensis]
MTLYSQTDYPEIVGYTDRLSVRPGENLSLKASALRDGWVDVDIVRIWSADANPDGPGMHIEAVRSLPSMGFNGRYQSTELGSYGVVPLASIISRPKFILSFAVQPWLIRQEDSVLLSCGEGTGWALSLTENSVSLRGINGSSELSLPISLKRKKWYHVELVFEADLQEAGLSVTCHESGQKYQARGAVSLSANMGANLHIAAEKTSNSVRGHFNGRIEDVTVRTLDGEVLAFWDFSVAIEGISIIDTGPAGLHGHFVNLPTRGVRGSLWDGSEHNFHHAPRHYAAVHFHEDDIYDCGWETDLEVYLPDDLESGVYGLRMSRGDAQDIVPFFVKPPHGGATARICYLANTFTYQAYANHARDNFDEVMEEKIRTWRTPKGPDTYSQFGYSTYNFHPDGSGIAFSSRLRPLLTMRPGFLTFAIHEGSGLRHFPADSHLVEWFRRKGLDFDVVTDEDLHNEGVELIQSYNVVVTGTHPEYHTTRSLDALRDYRDSGGNLVYLGGNGFYWRIAKSDRLPGAIEVRRAEGGIRAWAAEPGECYQSFDGCYGGLWRRNGRPPQELVGVGFSAQGLFEGTYYLRTEASYDPEVSWIFEGVEEERIGDYGFSGGGAAGFELDRADVELGTPEETVILARSTDHPESFSVVPEEILNHIRTIPGESPSDLIRSELIYMKLQSGAQVFSTGSISFCGSLPCNDFANGISRLLENVIRGFSDENS